MPSWILVLLPEMTQRAGFLGILSIDGYGFGCNCKGGRIIYGKYEFWTLGVRKMRIMDKDPKDMTDDEKFDICVLAGCAVTPHQKANGKFYLRTVHPCGVLHDGEKYIVGRRINSRQER